MSLDRLLEMIEADARQEGVGMVARAKEEAEKLKEQGKEEALLSAETIRGSYLEKAERERVKIMSEALSESRTTFLSTQDNLFNDVFTAALSAAEDMKKKEYRAWLKRLIMEGLASGKEKILAASYDRGLLAEGLLDEINQELKAGGRKGSLSLAKGEAEFSRGVILRGEKIENNLSLETVLREVRDRHEADLLRILFGKEGFQGGVRDVQD